LFLDAQLQVLWFTPATRELFPLTAGDVGRPITDLVQRFEDRDFLKDACAVIETAEPREAEVRNREGRWFLRRIRPYTSADERITGRRVSCTDTRDGKQAEVALRASQERLQQILASAVDGVEVEVQSPVETAVRRAMERQLRAVESTLIQSRGGVLLGT